MDQFLMYSPSSFTPDSGLSVAASQTTKQAQAARRAVERRLQIQINVVEDLETRLDIADRWIPESSDYRETLDYSQ
jgi:hypothetical protein